MVRAHVNLAGSAASGGPGNSQHGETPRAPLGLFSSDRSGVPQPGPPVPAHQAVAG